MNTISKQPPSTRQFFLVAVALSVVSFIPLIGWLSAFFLVCWLIAWILLDTRGFLSITWRTILCAVLLCSTWILLVYLPGPGTYDEKTQFVTAGVIGFALSAFGLVRSILNARKATS
jgi:hypothetical protein